MKAAERETHYQISMSIAADMLEKGIINIDDYHSFEEKMREKYQPTFSDIFWVKPSN